MTILSRLINYIDPYLLPRSDGRLILLHYLTVAWQTNFSSITVEKVTEPIFWTARIIFLSLQCTTYFTA